MSASADAPRIILFSKITLTVAAVPSPMPFVQRCAREGVEQALRNSTVSLSTIALSQMRRMSYYQSYRGGLRQQLAEDLFIARESGGACSFDEQRNRNQGQNRQA